MAQRRMLNRSLGSSRKFGALSKVAPKRLVDFSQALFTLVMASCDDHGRNIGDAFGVKHEVFPVSLHSEADFDVALLALDRVDLVRLYESDGRRYLLVVNFRREQSGMKYVGKPWYPEPSPEVVNRQQLAGLPQDLPGLDPIAPKSFYSSSLLLSSSGDLGSSGATPKKREKTPKPPRASPAGPPASRSSAAREILDHWNAQPGLIHHKSINGQETYLAKAVKTHTADEIKTAITRYSEVRAGPPGKYRSVYSWTLGEFVSRRNGFNLVRFLADGWEEAFRPFESSGQGPPAGEKKSRYEEMFGHQDEHPETPGGLLKL